MALLPLCALALPFVASGMASFSGRRQEIGVAHGTDPVDEIMHRGEQMTQAAWLASGPEALVALKGKVFNSTAFKDSVKSKCPEGGECSFNKGVMLFCESLNAAAAQEKLGDMKTLKNMLISATLSNSFYGVDTVTQSALIARWDKEEQWPKEDDESRETPEAFTSLKQDILGRKGALSLVEDTCHELSEKRPGCESKASPQIFCEALGQAAAVLLGAEEAMHRVGEVLQGPSSPPASAAAPAYSPTAAPAAPAAPVYTAAPASPAATAAPVYAAAPASPA